GRFVAGSVPTATRTTRPPSEPQDHVAAPLPSNCRSHTDESVATPMASAWPVVGLLQAARAVIDLAVVPDSVQSHALLRSALSRRYQSLLSLPMPNTSGPPVAGSVATAIAVT